MNKNKINASVISHVGTLSEECHNDYYINGRFYYYNRQSSTQASVEQLDRVQVYGVSEHLDRQSIEDGSSISFTDELKKFHTRSLKQHSNIGSSINQLYENLETIYKNAMENIEERSGEPALAVLLMFDGKAEVICTTNTRVYLLRNRELKQLGWDTRKAERLLRMGIITDEQAEALSERMGLASAENRNEIKRTGSFDLRENDVILIASNNLLDYLDEESIVYILSLDSDTAFVVNTMMKEILKRQRKDDIALQVIRILESASAPQDDDPKDSLRYIHTSQGEKEKLQKTSFLPKTTGVRKISKAKIRKIKKITRLAVSTLVIFAIVFGMFWGINRLLFGDKKPKSNIPNNANGQHVFNPDLDGETTGEGDHTGDLPGDNVEPGEDGNSTDNQPNNDNEISDEPAGDFEIYVVKSGDTLMEISRTYYNDPSKYTLIKEANNMTDDNIFVGQELKIPKLD